MRFISGLTYLLSLDPLVGRGEDTPTAFFTDSTPSVSQSGAWVPAPHSHQILATPLLMHVTLTFVMFNAGVMSSSL